MFLGKDVHLGSQLTKSLSSVRLLGVVRFRSLPFLVVMDFLPHVKPISLLNLRALMRRKSCAVRMRNETNKFEQGKMAGKNSWEEKPTENKFIQKKGRILLSKRSHYNSAARCLKY